MKNNLAAFLLAMFLVWDYEPGCQDKLEISFEANGPWFPYLATLAPPPEGVYRVQVPEGFRKAFFRVKREIKFDIKPKS